MENFALIALAEEIKQAATGMVVRRVVQSHAAGFIFQSRTTQFAALKISLDARNPVAYLSDARPPHEFTGSDFLLVLRKHLSSARLVDVRKPLSERIVEFQFRTTLPARELETVTLVAELMPNAPNLWLLDGARRILAGFSPPGPHRGLTEYGEYAPPPLAKIGLEAVLAEERSWFDLEGFRQAPRKWLIDTLAGVGPILAGEIAHRHQASDAQPLPELASILERVQAPARTVWTYTSQPWGALLERNDLEALRSAVVSPIELESLRRTHAFQSQPGMLEAVRAVYDEIESRALLEKEKAPRLRQLRDEHRRLGQQGRRLQERKRQYEEAAGLQETAKLLVASGADMNRRHERIDVVDYSGDRPRPGTIPVDPSRTLRENVNRMFKRHQKAARGLSRVVAELAALDEAELRVEADLRRVQAIGDWTTWRSLGPRPDDGDRSARPRPAPAAAARRSRGRQFDGHEVLVGRSSRENDEITFKVAAGDDFWLHVAGYSGSHVIVRNPGREAELTPSVLQRAAELAAYYSQARNAHKVDVHYTQRKFVTKPRRAKPGLVQLRQFKTVTVEPRNWLRETDG